MINLRPQSHPPPHLRSQLLTPSSYLYEYVFAHCLLRVQGGISLLSTTPWRRIRTLCKLRDRPWGIQCVGLDTRRIYCIFIGIRGNRKPMAAGECFFYLSVSALPPAPSDCPGPGPLNKKTKTGGASAKVLWPKALQTGEFSSVLAAKTSAQPPSAPCRPT